jgi:hypothetical protein
VDSEGWYGLTVRTHEGAVMAVLGVVVGVFAQGPLAGRLCVQPRERRDFSPCLREHRSASPHALPLHRLRGGSLGDGVDPPQAALHGLPQPHQQGSALRFRA